MGTENRADALDEIPRNLDAERAVIGAMLLSDDDRDDVLLHVQPEEFYLESHQHVVRTMREMHDAGEPIDVLTVAEKLHSQNKLADIGGVGEIAKWMESCPKVSHADYYAKLVREEHCRRAARDAFYQGLRALSDRSLSSEEVLEQSGLAISRVQDLGAGESALDIGQILLSSIDEIMGGGESPSISTGYADIDKLLGGGLRPGGLLIVAARTSVGKTALALNMLVRIAKQERRSQNRACVFFSLEQPWLEVTERMLSTEAKVPLLLIREPMNMGDDDRDRIHQACTRLSDLRIFIDETSRMTVSRMMAISRRIRRRHGLCVVLVDYLQILSPVDRRSPREQQVSELVRELKHMARQLECAVICLCQLNRQPDARKGSEPGRPQLSDLRESGSIEQEADVVGLLWKPAQHDAVKQDGSGDKYAETEMVLFLDKNRNGPTGRVDLHWTKETVTFHEAANDLHDAWAEALERGRHL